MTTIEFEGNQPADIDLTNPPGAAFIQQRAVWQQVGIGFVLFCTAGLLAAMFLFFPDLTLPDSVQWLYELGGTWLVVGLFGVGALVFWAAAAYAFLSNLRHPHQAAATYSPQELNAYLQQLLQFTEVDLALNRQGTLSERQRTTIKPYVHGSVYSLVGNGVMLFVFGGIALFFLAITFIWPMDMAPFVYFSETPLLGLFMTGIFSLVSLWTLFTFARSIMHRQQMKQGKVKQVSGRIRLKASRLSGEARWLSGAKYSCMLLIGWKKFYVTERELRAFQQGQSYRLYYLDNAPLRILVAAEVVE